MFVLQSMHEQSSLVGRLGTLDVCPGYYVYVGSAFGPGGLRARVGRHASTAKRKRWHIDYLLDLVRPIETWCTVGTEKHEHVWAQATSRISGAVVPMRGFGSSGCRCESHLCHFAKRPSAQVSEEALGAAVHSTAAASGRRGRDRRPDSLRIHHRDAFNASLSAESSRIHDIDTRYLFPGLEACGNPKLLRLLKCRLFPDRSPFPKVVLYTRFWDADRCGSGKRLAGCGWARPLEGRG